MRNRGINPELARRRNGSPKWRGSPTVHQASNAIAVDCKGYCLAKLELPEPALFAHNLAGLRRNRSVQIKKKKVVFETWAKVVEINGLVALQKRCIGRT